MAREEGLYAIISSEKGEIVLSLEFEKTPMTVANFVGLAKGELDNDEKDAGEPYYDGLKFHRVIDNFMVQGGCPKGSGVGGPGYNFPDEIHSDLKHDGPGVLSMANSGPGTNGSQFFITHLETPWLDGKHTVFGKVVEGMDVVNQIAGGDIMKSVKIEAVGVKAEAFNAKEIFVSSLQKFIGDEQDRQETERKAMLDKYAAKFPDADFQSSGLIKAVTQEGTGAEATLGSKVTVHYTGRLLDGSVFDSSHNRNEPFEFELGAGMVISGWEEGVKGMKVGEKVTLVIPYHMAYGEGGYPPVIPPKATLEFDVELLKVK